MSFPALVSLLVFLFTGITGGGGFALVEHWLPESENKTTWFRIFAVLMFVCVLAGIYALIQPTGLELILFSVFTAFVTGGSFRLVRNYPNEVEGWIKNSL